jgi:flagellar hook-associated protein 2
VSTVSTTGLTGMGTNIDWQSMLTQLQAVSEQSLTPYNDQITTLNYKASAWTTFSGDLNALQTASTALTNSNGGNGLNLYSATVGSSSSVSPSSLLTASASSTASAGSYNVVINNSAQAAQLASGDFSSQTAALNISGTILVNGKAVEIGTSDTLQTLEANINNANAGVSAAIMQDSPTTSRLVLTSGTTGAAGITLSDGSASNTLESLGFNGSGPTVIQNSVAGGAQSLTFSNSSTGVSALLGIASGTSGNVTINGKSVTINLDDTLTTTQANLATAGISSSIVTASDGVSKTLQIAGMTSWTDNNNVLQTLGLIQGNRADTVGVTGSVANTSDGSTPITAATVISSIYGYNKYTAGDKITLSGTASGGAAVAATDFAITQGTTTVGDLLNEIHSLFGNVTATVTSAGKIQVIDNATGTSKLSVNLQSSLQDPNAGQLSFGSFGQAGTISKYVLQQGTNAAFTVDGMSMTSSSNTVTSAIGGVTLNLLGADPNTTLTVNVAHNTQAIETNVNTWLSAYNSVISFVDTQNTYNSSSNTTGGPLFGDNTLETIKSQLQSAIMNRVGTGSMDFLANIGITAGSNGTLSLNSATFEQSLSSNFSGVANLFSDSGSSSNSQFQYAYCNSNTKSGQYNVNITGLPAPNIAGTIDNLAATGSGNVLTLSNTASGANGLAVSYTGTTTGASATITVNRGIASLINGLLSGYTNSTNGTIATEQTGLKNSVSQLNTQVTNMQANIDSQMATLKEEFLNMDAAVAKMYQMQSYLTTQLANL